MSISPLFRLNRTNVRLFIAWIAVGAAGGCSTLPAQVAGATPCPPTRTPICEAFGSESRCRCSDSLRVDRQLERLGVVAQTSLSAW